MLCLDKTRISCICKDVFFLHLNRIREISQWKNKFYGFLCKFCYQVFLSCGTDRGTDFDKNMKIFVTTFLTTILNRS